MIIRLIRFILVLSTLFIYFFAVKNNIFICRDNYFFQWRGGVQFSSCFDAWWILAFHCLRVSQNLLSVHKSMLKEIQIFNDVSLYTFITLKYSLFSDMQYATGVTGEVPPKSSFWWNNNASIFIDNLSEYYFLF